MEAPETFSLSSETLPPAPRALPQNVVSASDLAEMLGITTSELSRQERLGITHSAGERGLWLLKESVAGYVARLKEKTAEKPSDRLLKAKAEAAEIKVEKELGTLVEAEKATAAFVDLIARARRQLEAIPARIAALLAETTVPATVAEILKKEIERALETISKNKEEETEK